MKAKLSVTKLEAEIQIDKEEVGEFFNGVVPNSVKELGGILTDTVRYWRFKNQVSIVKKAKKILEENNLQKHQVSLKTLVPLLEAASLEEEESMQARWANLLINAISGAMEIRPNYVEILKELAPIEALILDKVYDEASKEPDYEKRLSLSFSKDAVCKWFSISSVNFDLIIENLFRLNLCRMPGTSGIMFGENKVAMHTTKLFEFTTMGFNFVKACKEPNK